MRLLHIIASMDPVSGGPCQGIRNNNSILRDLGVYREVVCLDDPLSPFLGLDDFPIHALGPAKGVWQYSAKLIPWLFANMPSFDVVIINGLWIFSSYAGWKTLKNIKKKGETAKIPRVFVMPHGMLDPYFQLASHRKLKAIRNKIYWNLVERKILNDANGVLFTSETELLLARESFKNYHPKKEHNIGYGIAVPPAFTPDMQVAFNAQCPEAKGQPYVLFLGRIHKKKGVDMLIESYIELCNKVRDKPLPLLVIAGPGIGSQFGKRVLKLLSNLTNNKGKIVFPGMLTGDAKWGALYGADAFVLPSHQENFGIAVVEALACGKPVLISDQINIWKEIKAGGGGIVANDTKEGTLNLLKAWLSLSDKDKATMSRFALDVYLKKFNVVQAAKAFYKIISQES